MQFTNDYNLKGDFKILPKEYMRAHEFCFMVHDLIVESIVSGEKAGIFQRIVTDLPDNVVEVIKSKQKQDPSFDTEQWLDENDYSGKVILSYYRYVSLGLISDMMHNIFEALECSRKGKLAQALQLLRKPLTENLFYLERLIFDKNDFLTTFWKEDIRNTDITNKKKEVGYIKNMIKEICQRKDYLAVECYKDIYELRYNLDSKDSFAPFCHQATHLITTRKESYKTSNSTFNLLFLTYNDRESLWELIYENLPVLLMHMYSVVESVLGLIGRRLSHDVDPSDFRIIIGYLILRDQGKRKVHGKELMDQLKDLVDLANIRCVDCGAESSTSLESYFDFYHSAIVKCSRCDFHLDFLEINKLIEKEFKGLKDSESN